MKNKKIIILILSLYIGFFMHYGNFVLAAEQKFSDTDADTYISEMDPTSNRGFIPYLLVSPTYKCESYIHFDFTEKPSNWIKAEIEISISSTTIPFYLALYLITEQWDEYTLIWDNKPLLGDLITSLTIYNSGTLTFNISNYIIGDGISICLKTTQTDPGYLEIRSKESSRPPKLIWTYERKEIKGYDLPVLILGISGIVFIIYRKLRLQY